MKEIFPWNVSGYASVVHRHRVAHLHVRQIALIDIGQHPHRAHVRNRERLRRARLQHLPRRNQPLHHFSADRREQRNLRGGRRLLQILRLRNAQNFHALLGRVQIRLRLVAIRFGLQQIALGDGVVLVEILRAVVILVRHAKACRALSGKLRAAANNPGC